MTRARVPIVEEGLRGIANPQPKIKGFRLSAVAQLADTPIDLAQSVLTVAVYHFLSRYPDLAFLGHGT